MRSPVRALLVVSALLVVGASLPPASSSMAPATREAALRRRLRDGSGGGDAQLSLTGGSQHKAPIGEAQLLRNLRGLAARSLAQLRAKPLEAVTFWVDSPYNDTSAADDGSVRVAEGEAGDGSSSEVPTAALIHTDSTTLEVQ